jgi:uncharacterized membrane protein
MFIGTVPWVGGPTIGGLGLIGFILLLIGMWGLGGYYKESGIFNNALYGTIAGIVGAAAAVGVFIAVIFSSLENLLYEIFPTWDGSWATLGQQNPTDVANIDFSNIGPFIAGVLGVLIIAFVVILLVAIFYRKSLNILKEKSGVGLFGTTGTLLLVGAVLTIIFIGIILVWIALLILAIAFFSMGSEPKQQAPPQM